MKISNQSVLYGLGVVSVLLATLLIDRLLFSPDEHKRFEESKDKQVPSARLNDKTLAPKVSPVQHMAFVNIALPPPPSLSTNDLNKNTKTRRNESSNNEIRELEEGGIKRNVANTVTNNDGTVTDVVIASNHIDNNERLSTPTATAVTKSLKQLAKLKGNNRALLFPDNHVVEILEYMHSCIGIDVGAVKQNSLTVLSNKHKQHSQMLRVANGYQTSQEKALLDIYAPSQTLVRLYPVWFDERLGKALASHLGNTPLTQMSGQYMLRGNSLWLTNVVVNNQGITRQWQLTQSC